MWREIKNCRFRRLRACGRSSEDTTLLFLTVWKCVFGIEPIKCQNLPYPATIFEHVSLTLQATCMWPLIDNELLDPETPTSNLEWSGHLYRWLLRLVWLVRLGWKPRYDINLQKAVPRWFSVWELQEYWWALKSPRIKVSFNKLQPVSHLRHSCDLVR